MNLGYGLYIDTPAKGAGSAITNAYGIMVKVQNQGGTSNYGIYVEAPSGGSSNNNAIQAVVGDRGLVVVGPSTGAGTTKYGVSASVAFDSTTTVAAHSVAAYSTVGATCAALYGFYSAVTTAAAVFTLTNRYGVYVENTAKGATSTITNDYGVYIVGPTQGGTTNIGLYNGGTSTLVGAVNVTAEVNITGAATSRGAGVLSLGGTQQTTVGAAGGASALPATPSGYIKIYIGATQYVIPYYAQA
jgi:hypothetical protein